MNCLVPLYRYVPEDSEAGPLKGTDRGLVVVLDIGVNQPSESIDEDSPDSRLDQDATKPPATTAGIDAHVNHCLARASRFKARLADRDVICVQPDQDAACVVC